MSIAIKNINTIIHVKLNEKGRTIEKSYNHEMYKAHSAILNPKKEDNQGFTKWVLWEFMATFGEWCFCGADAFFDKIIVGKE